MDGERAQRLAVRLLDQFQPESPHCRSYVHAGRSQVVLLFPPPSRGGQSAMKATGVSHIGICVRDMDKSLAFYRDALGMEVLGDRATDPSEGGRPHNYKHRRETRRWVSLSYGEGASPTLTLTSHPGEAADGQPILLDQVGITHFSFAVGSGGLKHRYIIGWSLLQLAKICSNAEVVLTKYGA